MASELALIKATRAAILADASLNALFGGRVFMTWMPDDTDYPLITITHSPVRDDRSHGIGVDSFTLYVDVWARRGGEEDPANVWVREQANAAQNLLDEPSFDLGGYALIQMICTGRTPLPEPSNNIERARVTFSVSVQRP